MTVYHLCDICRAKMAEYIVDINENQEISMDQWTHNLGNNIDWKESIKRKYIMNDQVTPQMAEANAALQVAKDLQKLTADEQAEIAVQPKELTEGTPVPAPVQ